MPEPVTEPAVLLFRGRGVVSTIIRWQTRSAYSHAALLLPDGRSIVESWQGSGVRIKPINDWKGVDRYAVAGMSKEDWAIAIGYARQQIGSHYDYMGVFRFITREKIAPNGHWFCSELVFAALAHAGVRLLHRIEPEEVSPGHLSLSPLLIPQ